jgi:hypothetical protein
MINEYVTDSPEALAAIADWSDTSTDVCLV